MATKTNSVENPRLMEKDRSTEIAEVQLESFSNGTVVTADDSQQ